MQMSPVHVPENTISSDQPYTAHIIVSVFPMFPLRPIRPPPEEREAGSQLTARRVTAKTEFGLLEFLLFDEETPRGLTSLMPKLHVFHTSCDELVRKVGIYFDNKNLVLASPEKQYLHHKIYIHKKGYSYIWCLRKVWSHHYFLEPDENTFELE